MKLLKINFETSTQNFTPESSVLNNRNFISLVIKCKEIDATKEDQKLSRPKEITLSEENSCTMFDIEKQSKNNNMERSFNNSKIKEFKVNPFSMVAMSEYDIASPASVNESLVKLDSKF